jgi:predicted amidohydrolase
MADTFRMALVSMKHQYFNPKDPSKDWRGDLPFNLQRHRYWLHKAMRHQPDFVGFPEFSLTGWVSRDDSVLTLDSPQLRQVEAWAKEFNVIIGTCFVEKNAGHLYNTAVLMGPQGRIGIMRKVNLILAEAKYFMPGTEFPVFDLGKCKMSIAICADASQHEIHHLLSMRGAEVIFAPHANSLVDMGNSPAGWLRWRKKEWPPIAKNACVYIAGMSCAGLFEKPVPNEEITKFCGGAAVVDFNGNLIASIRLKKKRETMLVADLDIDALRKARALHQRFKYFRASIIYNRPDGWAVHPVPGEYGRTTGASTRA